MTYLKLTKVFGIVPILLVGALTASAIEKDIKKEVEGNEVEKKKVEQKEDCTSPLSKEKYKLKTTYRFQNLMTSNYTLTDDDFDANEIATNFLVRRARIKLEGVPANNFKYKMEIGLSNRDHGSIVEQTNKTSRLILDAYITYNLPKAKGFSLKVGQMKLAGNVERVISSQRLQLVDRSLVNSKYNIDRDIAIQANYKKSLSGGAIIKTMFSLAQGEGRNITTGNEGGYEYTGRVEFLPFGKFNEVSSVGGKRAIVAGNGGYISSDFVKHNCPKLQIGLTYDQNNNAVRQNGNTKSYMNAYRTLQTVFADLMFKYNGISVMAEYADKQAPEGSVIASDSLGNPTSFFYTGRGTNLQAGYIFKRNGNDLGKGLSELTVRYTNIQPSKENKIDDINMYTLGYSRYVDKHNIKIQTDISLTQTGDKDPVLMYRLQMEMALSGFKIKR